MKKAIAYARYSSDNQSDNSIEAQVSAIKDYCKREKIYLKDTYVDRAETGTNTDREGFQELLSDVKNNRYDYVIFHKSDRLARNRIEAIMTKKMIRESGAEVVFVVGGNFDTDTPEGMMMESLAETLDEYYSMNLSRETKKGMENIAKKGLHTGGVPPLGYDVVDKRYKINHREAIAVKRIFELFNQNYGYFKISEIVNDEGHRTKRGRTFSKGSIYDIITNEKYTGTMIYNKNNRKNSRKERADIIKVENAFEPIIDKLTFFTIQKKINSRVRPKPVKRNYFLTGYAKCHCGSHFVGNTTGAGKYRYFTYACTNMRTKGECKVKTVNAVQLEKLAIRIIVEDIFTDDFVKALAVEVKEYNQRTNKNTYNEFRQLNIDKSNIEINMNKILDLYLDEMITKEQFKERSDLDKKQLVIIDERLKIITEKRKEINLEELTKEFLTGLTVEAALNNKKLINLLVNEFMSEIIIDNHNIRFELKIGDAYPHVYLNYNFKRDKKNICFKGVLKALRNFLLKQ